MATTYAIPHSVIASLTLLHTIFHRQRKHVSCLNATHWTWIWFRRAKQWVKLYSTKTNFESYIQITINTILFWIVNESSMCVCLCECFNAHTMASPLISPSALNLYIVCVCACMCSCDFSDLHPKKKTTNKNIYTWKFYQYNINTMSNGIGNSVI